MNFTQTLGLGVAGNFTGHLEQAGEASDFTHVICDEECAPKGVFPFYIPNDGGFLGVYPISSNKITAKSALELQAEPECALLCDAIYENEKLIKLTPQYFGAFNDCSIRKEGAKKISEKKNWGADSKGLADNLIKIDEFSPNGNIHNYNIVSFLKRDDNLHEYGVNSPLSEYSYFYDKLIVWLIDKINNQSDFGPLEKIPLANCPSQILITIGATRYTAFGENDRLKNEDEIFVVLYPQKHSLQDIKNAIIQNQNFASDISCLHQCVSFL